MPVYRKYNNGWLLENRKSNLIELNLLFLVPRLNVQCQKLSPLFSCQHSWNILHPADIVKILSVWFDADFSLSEPVKKACKAPSSGHTTFVELDGVSLNKGSPGYKCLSQ